jgi:hypothetical protein
MCVAALKRPSLKLSVFTELMEFSTLRPRHGLSSTATDRTRTTAAPSAFSAYIVWNIVNSLNFIELNSIASGLLLTFFVGRAGDRRPGKAGQDDPSPPSRPFRGSPHP